MKYDIIGDIHGHADHLKKLLTKLGYEDKAGHFQHGDGRRALFVGDYIDRGPKIKETVDMVRAIVENESAVALMGNHEYNAILFNTWSEGEYLRPHLIKNYNQHHQTLLQYLGNQEGYDEMIRWFKTLPLWYEDENIRAVHACWEESCIKPLQSRLPNNKLDDQSIIESANKQSEWYEPVDTTLKGRELKMPEGQFFFDKDGHKRSHIRIKWWLDQRKTNYQEISVIEMNDKLTDDPVSEPSSQYYQEDEKPVFFGHYWLQGHPNLYRGNVCCLDYSVAKGGYLAAYRYDGESILSNSKLVFV